MRLRHADLVPDVVGTKPAAQSQRRALLRAFGLLRERPAQSAIVLTLTIALAAVGLLTPWLFGQAVDAVQQKDESRTVWLGGAAVVAGITAAVIGGLRQLLSGRLAVDLEVSLRNEVYGHMLSLDQSFHQKRQVGQLVSLIMVTSRPIRGFLAVSMPQITSDLLMFVFAGAALAVIDPRLAVLSVWPIPIVIYLVVRMGRVVTPVMKSRQEAMADVTASGEETLRQIVGVYVLAARDARAEHFASHTDQWFSISRMMVRAGARYKAAVENLPNFAWAGLFLLGGYSVVDGTLELGTFVTFLGYVGLMLSPLSHLGARLWTTQNASASAQRVFEILDHEPLLLERTDAGVIDRARREVQLRSVTKRFDATVNAVDAVELNIATGSSIAIVGRTGSGKSTLLDLIRRLYDPDVGTVLVGGTPIDGVQLAALRSTVATVGSSPHLFVMTVFDNIVYGAGEATYDDVVEVTRALGIHDDISALVDGYSTVVGEGGVVVPAPLAQGISIARALVCRPGILLLDDVTASLPPAIERAVVDGLRVLTADMTVVAVAARPALLTLVDDIVVLEHGAVSAHGTFGELAATSAAFRELLEAWRLDHDVGPSPGRPG